VGLIESVFSDLTAGLVAAAILWAVAWLARRVQPGRARRWAARLRRLRWPLLAWVFLTTALTSAVWRGATGPAVVVLGALLLLAAACVLLRRFGSPTTRRIAGRVERHAWPILAAMFFLSTAMLLFLDIERSVTAGRRVVFVVDLADEEMMALRRILDRLQPRLQAEVFLMHVESDRQVGRLEKMLASGDMRWDLIAVDNSVLALLAKKGLVQDLSEYRHYDRLVPLSLVSSLRSLARREGRFYFVPFRPNVKIGFYNARKFVEYGLTPPQTWEELLHVAKVFKEKEGVERVAIHGYPGKAAAVTAFEFVKAGGGDPLTLDDAGSQHAFRFLQRLKSYLIPDYTDVTFDTANELLIDGEIYLVRNWTYGFKVVVEEAGRREIEVYSGWKGPAGAVHALGGDVLAIPAGAPHPTLATRLIELLLSKETQKTLLSRLRWPPVRQDVYDAASPDVRRYLQVVNDALSMAVVRPTVPSWRIVEKTLSHAFQELQRDGHDVAWLAKYAETLKRIPRRYTAYTVRSRATLPEIAARHDTSAELLAEVNGLMPLRPVRPGQILLLPQE
jgi:ABC-type glycerol-3-phosphate transport system substrate-binding protein